MNQHKRIPLLVFILFFNLSIQAQSILPTPFVYGSCGFGVSPTGYVNCVGSPDCAASRCNVPAGCSGDAVMCFGESFRHALSTPLTVGQAYDIEMSVSTGHLGVSNIINGNHTFQVVGTTSVPPTCGGSSYGSICSVAGGQVLLTGTVNTIGWVLFQNTFTATSAISHITITNCDNTGNGGNLFCSPSLTSSILAPVEIEHFEGVFNECQVELEWATSSNSPEVSRFDIIKTADNKPRQVIGTIEANASSGRQFFSFTDPDADQTGFYQLEMYDLSGKKSQSRVVEIEGYCPKPHLGIQSNPVTGDEAKLFYNPKGFGGKLQVLDVTGRKVYETVLDESGSLTLDVGSWKPGIYFISTSNGELTKMYLMR